LTEGTDNKEFDFRRSIEEEVRLYLRSSLHPHSPEKSGTRKDQNVVVHSSGSAPRDPRVHESSHQNKAHPTLLRPAFGKPLEVAWLKERTLDGRQLLAVVSNPRDSSLASFGSLLVDVLSGPSLPSLKHRLTQPETNLIRIHTHIAALYSFHFQLHPGITL
jgi:hypothetical protein